MIKAVKYHEIDFEKYTQCINHSAQKNWYAQKEILDHLSGNWQLLVWNDYEAVMPVHLKKKFGFNFVHMPLFCQQLGVFSKEDNSDLNEKFLQYLREKFLVFLYNFNDNNKFKTILESRKNYKVPTTEYAFLRRKKYFKGRKSTVKMAQYLEFSELQLSTETLHFIKNNYKGLSENDYAKLEDYISFLNEKKAVKFFGAYKETQIINLAVVIEEKNELHLLALINDEKMISENGASFLIDKVLEQNIEQKIFNFMGGNIRGIEVFFKSFGAELAEYPFLQNKFLTKLI